MIKLKKINDLNIHPIKLNKDLSSTINEDKNINFNQIEYFIRYFKKENLEFKNIMIMNENFFFNNKNFTKFSLLYPKTSKLDFTYLANFRNYKKTIKLINETNYIKRVKFHSYFQKITKRDFRNILKICEACEKKKISILIDASYGTLKLFEYDNLKLIVAIAEKVKKVPIVILHSGGLNVIKVMAIALSATNIFLETSFSLNFFEQSNLWHDFNFAYNKIGYDKIIYGSDMPYVNAKDSEKNIVKFFRNFKIKDKNIENIMYNNYFKV